MAPGVITSDNNNRDDDCNDNHRSESAKTNTMTPKKMARPVLVPGKMTFTDGCSKVTPEHPYYASLMKSAAKLDAKLAARRAAKQQRNGGIRKKECPVSIGKQKKNKVSTSTNAKKA